MKKITGEMLGYLLNLFVLADDLLASNGVMFDTVISRIDDQFTERSEATVTTDCEQRSVKEWMILTQIIFTLRPSQHQQHTCCEGINERITE